MCAGDKGVELVGCEMFYKECLGVCVWGGRDPLAGPAVGLQLVTLRKPEPDVVDKQTDGGPQKEPSLITMPGHHLGILQRVFPTTSGLVLGPTDAFSRVLGNLSLCLLVHGQRWDYRFPIPFPDHRQKQDVTDPERLLVSLLSPCMCYIHIDE